MKTPSTRLLLTIPFGVPAYWTPEQALAVIELLDDLRELIWDHYGPQLLDEIRDDRQPPHPIHPTRHRTIRRFEKRDIPE